MAGPLLIKEIARRNNGAHQVVAMCIVDMHSQQDTKNTMNALKSLDNVCNTNGIYLPISIFDNSFGKHSVDTTITHRVCRLVDILTYQTIGIDRNDRRNWLAANKVVDATPGLKLLHITMLNKGDHNENSGELWDYKDWIYDSVIDIASSDSAVGINVRSRNSYEGRFADSKIAPMMGVVGGPVEMFNGIISNIQHTLDQYNAQSHHKGTIFASDKDDTSDSGMVL